jgi:hypothetical protein
MLSVGLWWWYINITVTALDSTHRPVFYLKHTVDNVPRRTVDNGDISVSPYATSEVWSSRGTSWNGSANHTLLNKFISLAIILYLWTVYVTNNMAHGWNLVSTFTLWTVPPLLIHYSPISHKTNSVAFGPQTKYTNLQTADGQWILVPAFVDRWVSHGQRGGHPTAVNLIFLDWSRYLFFQLSPHVCSQSWEETVPDPLLISRSGGGGNRTRDLWVCNQEVSPLRGI